MLNQKKYQIINLSEIYSNIASNLIFEKNYKRALEFFEKMLRYKEVPHITEIIYMASCQSHLELPIDIPDLTPDLLAEYSIVLQYMYNYFKYYDVPVEIKQKNIIKNIAPNMFDQDLIDIFRFEIKKTLKTQNSYSNLYLFDKIIEDNMNEIY